MRECVHCLIVAGAARGNRCHIQRLLRADTLQRERARQHVNIYRANAGETENLHSRGRRKLQLDSRKRLVHQR